MTAVLAAIPIIPVAIAVLIPLIGRTGERWGGWIAVAGVAAALIALTIAGRVPVHADAVWMQAGTLTVTIGLRIDGLSRFVALVVGFVALVVFLYAVGYMRTARDQRRFFAALSLFVGAMLALVLADSTLLLFAAWEVVGLASWLLIGHERGDPTSVDAASKAFLVTRIADLAFLLGWLLLLLAVRTTDIPTVIGFSQRPENETICFIAAALMLVGAAGKSAQLPFSAWLPDAMTAPTPVSALLHSATMVAAGVYLLLRLYPVFAASPVMLDIVLWTGAVSAIVGAVVATWERDLKRLLAWSTIAQLGEMMMAVGFRAPLAALFHLTAHAAFKATLFLCAGAIERQTATRNLDELGGLRRSMPWTALTFAAASLALAAVPPFAGYFSEDAILRAASTYRIAWPVLLISLVFASGAYIGRAGVAVFVGSGSGVASGVPCLPGTLVDRGNRSRPRAAATDPPRLWLVPMLLLGVASLALGLFLRGSIGALVPLGSDMSGSSATTSAERMITIIASLAGLTWGGVRASRRGPIAAFGAWPAALNQLTAVIPSATARIVQTIARGTEPVERQVDRLARGAAFMFTSAAGVADTTETAFDRAARVMARANLLAADATERLESVGFAAGGDRFAGAVRAAGGELRRVQAGPIYVYTFVLVASVLVAGVAAILMHLRW